METLGALETIASRIQPMESHGLARLLGMISLQTTATLSPGMVLDGSPEVTEQINSPIHPMESHGLRPLLGMPFSQPTATQSHGMVHNGSLEAQETIP
jgi:hypothetical protein